MYLSLAIDYYTKMYMYYMVNICIVIIKMHFSSSSDNSLPVNEKWCRCEAK